MGGTNFPKLGYLRSELERLGKGTEAVFITGQSLKELRSLKRPQEHVIGVTNWLIDKSIYDRNYSVIIERFRIYN